MGIAKIFAGPPRNDTDILKTLLSWVRGTRDRQIGWKADRGSGRVFIEAAAIDGFCRKQLKGWIGEDGGKANRSYFLEGHARGIKPVQDDSHRRRKRRRRENRDRRIHVGRPVAHETPCDGH